MGGGKSAKLRRAEKRAAQGLTPSPLLQDPTVKEKLKKPKQADAGKDASSLSEADRLKLERKKARDKRKRVLKKLSHLEEEEDKRSKVERLKAKLDALKASKVENAAPAAEKKKKKKLPRKRKAASQDAAAEEEGDADAAAAAPKKSVAALTVFVGQLPFDWDVDRLTKYFKNAGMQAPKVRLLTEKDTGKSKGMGFVQVASEKEVKGMLRLNGKELGKRTINVERTDASMKAKERKHRQKQREKKAGENDDDEEGDGDEDDEDE
eukprot:TRINITY_DN6781_c0_g1_i1.p1 TRINITY_DN6781_c0_g1~~TRINITY_DN6781_c0_g1_i1.p1  ORF type:complete len:293 (+),score=113.30 TRINITY_DN6781_c0_g1_i1:87-881(+)